MEDKYAKDIQNSKDLLDFNKVKIIEYHNGSFAVELNDYKDHELPTVSVLTITYNRDYIFDIAVRNWSKFIYPKERIEWVILDDSPSNKVKYKLPSDERIKYFHLKDKIKTVGAKRNRGIELCSNDVICFMDDDDYYYPDSIINRVRVMLQYNKPLVGSVSLNCVNLIDNTSFITGGGLITMKNGDKCIICAEASLGFYKSFWLEQKFDEEIVCEEIIDFTRNRTSSFIDLNGAYIMMAFSHGRNMSDRALRDSINTKNFIEELDMNTVNFIEKLRVNILMNFDEHKQALEFYKKVMSKGLGTNAIYKKISDLPIKVQKSPIIKELRKQSPLYKQAPKGSVNILYYYLGLNTKVNKVVDFEYPDVYELEAFELAKILTRRGYRVVLYMFTDRDFPMETFNVKPYWKYNPICPCEKTIVYREPGILSEDIKSSEIYFLSADTPQKIKDAHVFRKCTKILVDNILDKFRFSEIYDYPVDNVELFDLLELSPNKFSTKAVQTDCVTVLSYINNNQLETLQKRFTKVYIKFNPDFKAEEENVIYTDFPHAYKTEFAVINNDNANLLYCKLMGYKVCFMAGNDIDFGKNELVFNFLKSGKKNDVIEKYFPYVKT